MATTKKKTTEKLGDIEKALGDALPDLKRTLGSRWEAELRSFEIKAGCRYPLNRGARVAWGVIRMKARAGIRATASEEAEFYKALGLKKTKSKL